MFYYTAIHKIFTFIIRLGQFTKNYTHTKKRTANNKTGGMLPERAAYRLFCCPEFPKELPLTHGFAKQSVVCYYTLLSALP